MSRSLLSIATAMIMAGTTSAELQFNADMPWSVQDVENAAPSGGAGGGSEPAPTDTDAWVTFANTHCGKSYGSYADFEAEVGTINCAVTDADITTNWPDKDALLGYQIDSDDFVTNLDFMANLRTLRILKILDYNGSIADISGLSSLESTQDITLWGAGITDVSPLDGLMITGGGTVFIDYGNTSATTVPHFASGSSFRSSGTAITLCDGSLGCSGPGGLTDVSGLANIDPSLLDAGGILLYNTTYAVKAPAASIFCTNWTTDVVWQANYTPVSKSNVCEP